MEQFNRHKFGDQQNKKLTDFQEFRVVNVSGNKIFQSFGQYLVNLVCIPGCKLRGHLANFP